MREKQKKQTIGRDAQRVSGWYAVIIVSILVLALALGYTVVRYVVFKGVSLSHLPLYLLNKALALASVVLIGLSFALGPLCRFWPKIFIPTLHLRKYFGLFGFGLAAIHAFISLLLLNQAYYPKFFEETGKLTFAGEASLLFGILAFFVFAVVSVTSLPHLEMHLPYDQWLFLQRLGYAAYVLTLLHVAAMGYAGWFDATTWPGKMMPITLVSAILIVFVLALRALVMVWPAKER